MSTVFYIARAEKHTHKCVRATTTQDLSFLCILLREILLVGLSLDPLLHPVKKTIKRNLEEVFIWTTTSLKTSYIHSAVDL